MRVKTITKLKQRLTLIIAGLFFLTFSNETFGMESLELEGKATSIRSAMISFDIEGHEIEIESESEIRQRLGQAIAAIYAENEGAAPAQFTLRELPPLLGSASGLAFSSFAVKKAGSSLFLKVYFGGATIVSVGVSRVWTLDALINEEWKHSKRKPITHALVNITSVLSTLPLTYAVWKNTGNVAIAGLAFIAEWSLATLGFYEFFNNFKFSNTSYQHLSQPENLSTPARQLFKNLTSQSDPDQFSEDLLSSLNSGAIASHEEENELILLDPMPLSLYKNAAKAVFYVVPVASLILNFVLSYNSVHEYTSSLYLIIPYIAATTVPSFALQLYTTSSTVDDLWGDTVNKRSYLKAKNRMLFYVFGALSLFFAGGSCVWGIDVVEEAFQNSFLKPALPLFMFTTAAQLIIFESHCFRDYLAKKYFRWKEVKGTDSEKRTITLFKILAEMGQQSKNTVSRLIARLNPLGWIKKCVSYFGASQ